MRELDDVRGSLPDPLAAVGESRVFFENSCNFPRSRALKRWEGSDVSTTPSSASRSKTARIVKGAGPRGYDRVEVGQRRGRKRKGPRPLVSHARRPALSSRHPVMITTRLCPGLPSLRDPAVRAVLMRAFAAGSDRLGFRLVHHSIQSNHLHLIAEARNESALSRGMQGLKVRIARALNRHWKRKGRVFVDRYHADVLKETWHVRNALVYVLQNARKHGWGLDAPDPYSSGPWFEGWSTRPFGTDPQSATRSSSLRLGPCPVQPARTWLLSAGWRLHGLIDVGEGPKVGLARVGMSRSP